MPFRFTVVFILLMAQPAFATSRIFPIFSEDNLNVEIVMIDDPRTPPPFEAAGLYQALAVSPKKDFPAPGSSYSKSIEFKNFKIQCGLPVRNTTDQLFTGCKIQVIAGNNSAILKSQNLVQIHFENDDAVEVLKSFQLGIDSNHEQIWSSANHSLTFEGSVSRKFFEMEFLGSSCF